MKYNRYRLDQVQINEGSRLYNKMSKNTEYLLSLEPDRVLYHFNEYAGLDTKGAESYGGWEGPWSAIRGEFLGHYVCACLNSYQSYKNRDEVLVKEFENRVGYIVKELAKCQQAIGKKQGEEYPGCEGYVAAIPTSQLDCVEKLEDITGYKTGVPYYVHHKTLKGLVEAYLVLGDELALEVAKGFIDYIYDRLKDYDIEYMEKMLNSKRFPVQYFKEFGGMHEVLLQFYAIKKDDKYLDIAQKFDRPSFTESLIQDRDEMAHHMQHANSEIPCVSGMGLYYELFDDEEYKKGVMNFMDWMTNGHTFVTGGTSGPSVYPDYGGEFFNYPNLHYGHVTFTSSKNGKDAGESCCAHNLNKIGDQILTWTMDPQTGDEYEKRFVNCVLPQQNDETGMFLYNLNLKQGAMKGFGTPDDSFWCCYCSGIEAYSSLQHGAFYHEGNTIYVNNFIDATLKDEDKGLVIKEETAFPDNGHMKFTFELENPQVLDIRIRIPGWATGKNSVTINGEPIKEELQPSSYVSIKREYKTGDVIEMNLEFMLYTERMPDKPDYVGVKYGPNVLVACTKPFNVFNGTEEELLNSLRPTGIPGEFELKMTKGRAVYQPLHRVKHELYNGYTIITKPIKEKLVDSILIGDKENMADHKWTGEAMRKSLRGTTQGIGTDMGGHLTFSLKNDSNETAYIKCKYWGSEYSQFKNFTPTIKLFDIQVKNQLGEYVNIATQWLDRIDPDNWHDKIYPVPKALTEGRDRIEVRFIAKDFGDVKGLVGNLYGEISLLHY